MKKLAIGILLITSSITALADSNLSAELLLGSADQKTNFEGSKSITGDDFSIGIRGTVTFNENFELELAYQNYGEAEDSFNGGYGNTISDKSTVKAFSFGVKGLIPLKNKLSLFGRAGLASWDFEVKETDSLSPVFDFNGEDDGVDLYFGAGIEYSIQKTWSLGLEYTYMELGLNVSGVKADHEVTNLGLSLGYDF